MEEKAEESGESGQKQNFCKMALKNLTKNIKKLMEDGTERDAYCVKCGQCYGCCRPVKCNYFFQESCKK